MAITMAIPTWWPSIAPMVKRFGKHPAKTTPAVTACRLSASCFPKRFTIGAIEGHQVGIAIVIAIHDHLVLVKNRRTAKAVHALERAGARQPLLTAREIIRRDHHFLPVEEGDIDPLAVGGRGARG